MISMVIIVDMVSYIVSHKVEPLAVFIIYLTHFGLVSQNGGIELGQHQLR